MMQRTSHIILPHESVALLPCAEAPIGIFDSGIGGLSIAQEIARYLPNENILYFADTANVPYGARSDDEIRQLTAEAVEWLYQQGCKVVVVACNTASAFSLEHLRQHYGNALPIIGLVPALKPAVLQTQTKVVSVLATPATFRGKLIQDVIQHFALPAGVKVLPLTCLDLVPLIEQGLQNSAECRLILSQLLQPVIDQGADHLVLGCTHYPFLKSTIQSLFGSQLILVDSGLAIARQTSRILIKNHLLFTKLNPQRVIQCVVSGNNARQLSPLLKNLLDSDLYWTLDDLNCVTIKAQ